MAGVQLAEGARVRGLQESGVRRGSERLMSFYDAHGWMYPFYGTHAPRREMERGGHPGRPLCSLR